MYKNTYSNTNNIIIILILVTCVNIYKYYYTCMNNLNYLNFNTGLVNVYIMKLIKHKNDRLHGIVSNKVGILISILFSLILQLDNVIISFSV